MQEFLSFFFLEGRLGIRISLLFWPGYYTSVRHQPSDQHYSFSCFSESYRQGWRRTAATCTSQNRFWKIPLQQPCVCEGIQNSSPPKQPQFKINQCASQTCGQYKDNDSTGLSLPPFFNLKLGYTLKNTRWTKIF